MGRSVDLLSLSSVLKRELLAPAARAAARIADVSVARQSPADPVLLQDARDRVFEVQEAITDITRWELRGAKDK